MSKKYVRWRNMNLPKVEKVELSTSHIVLRAAAVGVLILIALICFGNAINEFINVQPGWQEISVESDAVNCSTDFIFQYDFTDYGGDASAAYKLIISCYSDACENAYRIFYKDADGEEIQNLAYLNDHVNQVVTVDGDLYRALELLDASENRNIYLAPVYVEYDRVFLSGSVEEAAWYDPNQNPEVMEYIRELVAFCNDPQHIDLELLDDSQVCLHVSQEYLTYCQENEIEDLLDFGWMTNAFVIDYLSEQLIQAGYTSGYLSSYDGFTRNLDTREQSYSLNLFDDKGDTVYVAGVLSCVGQSSMVFLRDYPLDSKDSWHYMDFGNDNIVTSYIDPADGTSKCYYDNLVSYSNHAGCAEILIEMIPSFIADEYDATVFQAEADGIYTVWFEGYTLCHNGDASAVALSGSGQEVGYTISQK